VIPECLFDDEASIEIESVRWAPSELLLNLKLVDDDSRWVITCSAASAWRLQDRFTEGLSIREDDPILWQSQFAVYNLYFMGVSSDPYRAACDLLTAVPRDSGVLRSTPNALAKLLASGNGSLGWLPVPAIRICEPILKRHGVDVYHLGSDESETTAISHVLLFGNSSYVIAENFSAERGA
jgi:hypothetical protein